MPLLVGAMTLVSSTAPAPARAFNGDAYSDLVVGIEYEDVGSSTPNAGAVNVVHGGETGLTTAGSQFWHQDAGLEDQCETQDLFGAALAVGDFDGDGHFDLAVGVPREEVGGLPYAGAVNVLYGTGSGLAAAGDQLWTQDDATPVSATEAGDTFGSALAAGDFNGDGFDDLAIGAAGEDLWDGANLKEGAGSVFVVNGTSAGLSLANTVVDQCSGVPGECESSDHFGKVLAATPRRPLDMLFADGFESGDTGGWASAVP